MSDGVALQIAGAVKKPFEQHAKLHKEQKKRFKAMAKAEKDPKRKKEYNMASMEHGKHEGTLRMGAKKLMDIISRNSDYSKRPSEPGHDKFVKKASKAIEKMTKKGGK